MLNVSSDQISSPVVTFQPKLPVWLSFCASARYASLRRSASSPLVRSMAMVARCVNCLMILWCLGVGLQGCRDMIARVPKTSPPEDRIGVDQHARTPCDEISSRHVAQEGSD